MVAEHTLPHNDANLKEVIASMLANSSDLRDLAVHAVEAVLNEAMSIEADEVCNAPLGKRSDERDNYRNGYRSRGLSTTTGDITLKIPKLRQGSYFPESIIERYSRSDRALMAAVAEMYLKGVSTRKVERIVATLGVESMSADQVSRICSVLDEEVDSFRSRRFDNMQFAYLWLDATYVKCRNGAHVESQAIITAIAVGEDGIRRFVGFTCADTESYASWKLFLEELRSRGIEEVKLVISDSHAGLVRAIGEIYQGAGWQRCIVHLERNVASLMRTKKDRARALAVLKAVFKESDATLVRALYRTAIEEIEKISEKAAALLEEAEPDALAYLAYPSEHHKKLRTNNVQERANREIKRRSRVVQVFPSEASLTRLIGAVLAEIDEDWSTRCYIAPESLLEVFEPQEEKEPDGLDASDAMEKAALMIRLILDPEGKAA